MDIILNGACGRMGTTVRELVEGRADARIVAGVDASVADGDATAEAPLYQRLDDYRGEADVIIDFSNHTGTQALVTYALKRNLPLVIATTGQTREEQRLIEGAAKEIPVFYAANYSLGIAVLTKFARMAAELLPNPEVEIVETHHDQKIDAPSGTALALAHAVQESIPDATLVYGREGIHKRESNEIGIHSLRLGHVVGEHEVIISSGNEILSLKHTAESRTLFAEGALAAADFLTGKPVGLYGMADLVGE